MTQPDHTRITNKTAKKIFGVYEIKQKGQSRIWLDDNGWFTTVIEFQPFRGRQGTTLNIGVNFHWYEKEYFSFDIGYRQDVEFVAYDGNKERFLAEVEKLCEIALTKTLEYRDKLKNIDQAKSTILNHVFSSESILGSYHKGIICGLTRDFPQLNDFFQKLLKEDHPGEWLNELKDRVNFLISNADDQNQFTVTIIEIIRKTRVLKKLPEREIKLTE
jgi:hypothetical protein